MNPQISVSWSVVLLLWGMGYLPEAIRVARLLTLRITKPMGLNGFTSLNESSTSKGSADAMGGSFAFSRSDPWCKSMMFGGMALGEIASSPLVVLLLSERCWTIFWYVRLRSFRKVSRKKNKKSSQISPETIVKNQKIDRHPRPEVSAPPTMGPSAYIWIILRLRPKFLSQYSPVRREERCRIFPSVILAGSIRNRIGN